MALAYSCEIISINQSKSTEQVSDDVLAVARRLAHENAPPIVIVLGWSRLETMKTKRTKPIIVTTPKTLLKRCL